MSAALPTNLERPRLQSAGVARSKNPPGCRTTAQEGFARSRACTRRGSTTTSSTASAVPRSATSTRRHASGHARKTRHPHLRNEAVALRRPRIGSRATEREIKNQFRALAKALHPDTRAPDAAGDLGGGARGVRFVNGSALRRFRFVTGRSDLSSRSSGGRAARRPRRASVLALDLLDETARPRLVRTKTRGARPSRRTGASPSIAPSGTRSQTSSARSRRGFQRGTWWEGRATGTGARGLKLVSGETSLGPRPSWATRAEARVDGSRRRRRGGARFAGWPPPCSSSRDKRPESVGGSLAAYLSSDGVR